MRWIIKGFVGLFLLSPVSVFAGSVSSLSSESERAESSSEWTADSWSKSEEEGGGRRKKEAKPSRDDFYRGRGEGEFDRTDEFDQERERRIQESIEEESRRKEAEREKSEIDQALPERGVRRKDGRDGQGVKSFYEDDYVWLVDSIQDMRLKDIYRSSGTGSGSRMYMSQDEFDRPLLVGGLFSGQYLYPESVALSEAWFEAPDVPTKKRDKEEVSVLQQVPLVPVNLAGVYTGEAYNQVYGTEVLFGDGNQKRLIDEVLVQWASENPDKLLSYLVLLEYDSIEDKVPTGLYVVWAGVDHRGYFIPIQVKDVEGVEQEILFHQSYYIKNEDPDVLLDYETLEVTKRKKKDKKQTGWDARSVNVPEVIQEWRRKIFSTDFATDGLGFTLDQSAELKEKGFFETYEDPTDIALYDRFFGFIVRNPVVFILVGVIVFLAVAAAGAG